MFITLTFNEYKVYIPSSLLYYLGVIRLDEWIMEDDIWDGHEFSFEIVSFKRRDGIMIVSHLVEIKLLSLSLSKKISIYKVVFDVSSSIRYPI